ncbi:putative protein phosphatase 2C 66 [Sesamum angolense]|uniref:Protein-serine/threonine phosphatase n=1 Tax=Sesamum angolense TaxID=2727404 RepID=A0AAE2BUZ2_9LAMI|nr:putative protein phosphatase 2C 66 [Sesamum angolense]
MFITTIMVVLEACQFSTLMQVWDVLSNKEAVDIVASAPGRGTAARALVDCATRAWRLKYPTSKNDDCAVVCLFLEHVSVSDVPQAHNDPATVPEEANKVPQEEVEKVSTEVNFEDKNVDAAASHAAFIVPQGTTKESSEIVPVVEEVDEKPIDKTLGQSKRSLAECLLTAEDDEWSALEVRAPSSFPDSKIQVKKHCAKFIV